MFDFVLTMPCLHVEQADKQTPEVGSSDLVAIGHATSSAKAEPMQLRFQCTIIKYGSTLYLIVGIPKVA